MADLTSLLTVLEQDPDDAQALAALTTAARATPPDLRASRFASARKLLSARGRPDAVVQLIDIELENTGDVDRQVDLLLEKGMLLDGELLDVPAARGAFEHVLKLRPDDTMAKEALDELAVSEQNWQAFAAKYVKEASGSTDRSLATGLYSSAAEHYVRFAPDAPEAEIYLRKALEVDPKNTKASFHLARLLRRAQRWPALAALLEERAEHAATTEEKITSLLGLAAVSRGALDDHKRADDAIKRVLALDPAQSQALRAITDAHAAAANWPAVISVYQAALKSRRDEDLGILLQIAMVMWKHMNDLDHAEEYFRRIRKIEPAHPAALDFYRVYYPAKGENQKLLQLLRQVEKHAATPDRGKGIGVEIAALAEAQNNPEKAIEAWKAQLRLDPTSTEARTALARLYRRTEKWNALLDLMKEEIDRLPESDVAARVGKLFEVVEIYRDKLRLDVMVINTYNSILKLDADNKRAGDELAAKFRALGRWNDLIAVLTRKSEAPNVPDKERVPLLREVADLWSERFGNFANAIKPLERLLELAPTDHDAIGKLKEIYTRRRQWRALIDVLGREANALPQAGRRQKQAEMARLAAERLGDARLAIEIYNSILAEVDGGDAAEVLALLAGLYDREKRWLALAEILHRQVAALAPAKPKEAIALLEKLGQVYAERLSSPAAAASAWKQILELEPGHAKALRTLRELYATAGDFAGLEGMYARLGQEEELVDALLAIADRLDGKAARLPIVERAAQLAQKRADAGAEAPPPTRGSKETVTPLERARQVWERVLAIDPQHVAAAAALVPIYTKQEKWARLIAVYEIELASAADKRARLVKIGQIRELCEHKLASKNLAFVWTLRAFEIDPTSDQLYAEVLRLASEPDQWREVAASFERNAASGALPDPIKLKLYRELSKIATRRLGDLERARNYHRAVIALAPEEREAEQHLEEIAIQLADWPELLASYRRRAAREKDPVDRVALLLEIAALQEEKLVDLDGAAATYHEALATSPGQLRALRALARIEEARGDWESLVEVLAQELDQTADGQARFDLLMRLGLLEEQSLDRPARALVHFRDALAIPTVGGGVRPQAVAALTRYVVAVGPGAKLSQADRVAAARLILPHLEQARQSAQHAMALEVIRAGEETTASEKLDVDRALMRIYHTDLGDPGAAWTAGLRVLAADPTDGETRRSLGVLAGQLGRDGEWAGELGKALDALRSRPSDTTPDSVQPLPGGGWEVRPAGEIRAVATELARVSGERLRDFATAERAWLTVLDVESDATDAFEALTLIYREEQRWPDLRALLERRAEVTLDDRVRRAVLLELASLEDDVLRDPGRAASAHRRVLEIDAGNVASYQALDRLYASGEQWEPLEELLARQVDHAKSLREQVELAYRRAELFAHKLNDPVRAVDLLEEVIARQRGHADARELLEECLPHPDVTLRVARLLEPLYEQDRLWRDLVGVLRAQRALATGTEAVELLSRIATIEEAELSGARNAFDSWIEVLGLDPTHERGRVELMRLAQTLNRWPEATAALEIAANATPATDVSTRAALLGELASYYDTQLGDTSRAIATYRRLLETDGASPATVRRAAAALARLYDEAKSWPELRAVTRRQADWAEDGGERRALLARVAALEEEQLADPENAIDTWRDILVDNPGDPGALHALERLYGTGGKWRELVDILGRKVDQRSESSGGGAGVTHEDADAKTLLYRIAEIHEYRLGEPDQAITAYLDVLDRDAHDPRALGELSRLYREAARHIDLLDILERQAQASAGDAQLALHVEIAKLLAGPLARPVDALDRWSDIVHVEPRHPEALGALEAALRDIDLRAMAAEILRPVYDATGQDEKLAGLLLQLSEWTDDPTVKLRALSEVVRLREERLADKAGAFAAQLTALRHAATEPELAAVIAETERLAGDLGREGDLIDVYREVAPNVLDAEIQRRLHLDIADLGRAVRQDLPLARDYYQRVLDAQPEDRRALAALESIYRTTNDDERLTDVLLRQADAAGADVDDRVGALVEAAQLYITLDRGDDAIGTWEQVLALAPERKDAVDALETLYREQGRWPDVVDLYERRLGFATSIEEAVALRVQLGDIHEKHLHDAETAIDNYAAALGGDAGNAPALAAVERYLNDPDIRAVAAEVLEPIYVAQHRWQDLIRVFQARLEAASDPRDRLRLTRFVARLYEEQLEDFESACKWYAMVFREEPGDDAIRDQLQRLASIVDNWGFVAQTYQEYLDDETAMTLEVRDVAIAAATIYDRRLGDVDRAYTAYRRALAIEADDAVPDARELVRRLEDLLGRAQKWDELVAVYDEVIVRADDHLRLESLSKRARLLEDGLADPARAIDAWREVVLATEGGSEPGVEHVYREAVGELERLYRARGQWHDLVDLHESRLARSRDPNETAELRLRLAEILETELKDLPTAIDQYEHVIEEGRAWDRAVAALERLVVNDAHRERIAGVLEPVYRREDWWQKLVVILDAKLAYIQDPSDQVAALHEIAGIHEQRGGALDLALTALARAWRIDVADEASLAKLMSLAAKLEAWEETANQLEAGAASAPNSDLAAALYARAADLHQHQRADHARAIAAWRKVDEAMPDDMVALNALDALLAREGHVDELVKVVARRAELTEDAGVRLVLLHRVAALYEEMLGDPPNAIIAYRNVLGVDDADLAALDALERLYRDTNDSRELAATLERKIELTTDLAIRQELRHAAAAVYENQLNDIYQAIGQLTAVLDDDAGDALALSELDRIYDKQKMWPELLDIVDRRSLLAISSRDRADLAYRAAHLVEVELGDPDAAIPRYGAVLQVLASHAAARAALEALLSKDHYVDAASPLLERVYRADKDAQGLVRVYARRLAASGARRSDWTALAEVYETMANQPQAAFAVWGRAISTDPDEVELLGPLMRLAESQNLWRELAAKLDELLIAPIPPDVEQAYAMRLGEIAETRLQDLERAATAYDRASHGPQPRPPLTALERVLARANRWADLAGVLRREADAADDDAQTADYLFRLGDLAETALGDPHGAVAAYREVLTTNSAHPGARAALERMLETNKAERGQIVEIVEILEPLFEQDNDAARLANVLEARLAVIDDPLDRASLLARLVELAEDQLNDRKRALDAALRWLAVDPASQQALAEVDRLAERLGQWREVADRVAAVVHAPDAKDREPDTQVALLTFLGQIQHDQLNELDASIASYRAALALDREASRALTDLIRIHRQRGDQASLAEVLRHRGQIAIEVPERRAAFSEVAQICERAGDRKGAIAAWREIADRDDADRDALDQLARIYRATGDRTALIDVLARAAELAGTPAEEKALRVEIAQLEIDVPRAIAAWQAVTDLDPDDLAALRALEAAHANAGDWMAVADIQSRRLSIADSAKDKVAIHAEMARLAESRRNSIDDAVASWFSVLDIDNTYKPAYAELERLLAVGQRWHDLVELLERFAELEATLGDAAGEIHALARAADVWEGKLDNPEAAGEILEKILARDPSSVAALTRLAKIYERSGDWAKCKQALEQALQLSPTGRDAADLFYRLGEVARIGDNDPATAILHLQEALRHDPGHAPTIAAVEKLARDRHDNVLLADMLQRRAAAAAAPADRIALHVEIADLERKAGRNDAALAALAKAASDAPNDVRVLAPLADLYFAGGRLDEAAPIYDRLAEDAKAARRMKDVARFRQRQGGILEARGDQRGALVAYEEALRVNPTDVVTMSGLGRLYFAAQDWEKARKIYQSLVLQNIDPEIGVTKAEVYWALGKIHLQLGQPPKAKSMFQRGLEIEPTNQRLREALAQIQ